MGGRGNSGISRGKQLSHEDWDWWSEDPSVFQRLEKGEDLREYFQEQYDEDEWEDLYQEASAIAREMGIRAESETLNTNTLYRGERFSSLEEAQKKFAVGKTITTGQLTSYSKDLDLARGYATMYGNSRVAVVITNTSTTGKFTATQANHSGYANKSNDPEVIVKRGFESKVTNTRYDKKNNILYVTMTNSVKPKRR